MDSMSKLVNWSVSALCDLLYNNEKIPGGIDNVADANKYLVNKGLYQKSLNNRTKRKINNAMTLESLRNQGIDPRGPGKQPPIQPIEAQIKRKSIAVPAGLTIKQFSFAIAKKVAKQGQRKRAYPFIQSAVKFGEEFFEIRANEAIGKDAEIDVTIILDSSPYLQKVR